MSEIHLDKYDLTYKKKNIINFDFVPKLGIGKRFMEKRRYKMS